MTISPEREYVLGTHDAELERLGLQHRVWRSHVLAHWRRAGVTAGQTILDIGCGPGFASRDLAELVGPSGAVHGFDLSERYLSAARALNVHLPHAQFYARDLMTDGLGVTGADIAWVRWVLCFLPKPDVALSAIRAALKPGGRLMLHEYADYRAWRAAPQEPDFELFVDQVMQSWRDHGGEPDIALQLPMLLLQAGFRVCEITPVIEVVQWMDPFWAWPAAFVETGLTRLEDLQAVTAGEAARMRAAWARITSNPHAYLTTPLVWKITAEAI
jgi:SAM-dependent methyltransferase